MIERRRALVAAAVGVVVGGGLLALGAVAVTLRQGVRLAGFDVRANAATPSLAGLRLEGVHAERPGLAVELPRATVSGLFGPWIVDAPIIHVVRTVVLDDDRDERADPPAQSSRSTAVRLSAEQLDLRDVAPGAGAEAGGHVEERGDAVVRVSSLVLTRGADRAIDARAASVLVERGAWSLSLEAPSASRSATREWTVHARQLRLEPREEDSASPAAAPNPVALGAAPSLAPRDDADRATELIGTAFVSGRAWLERAFARTPKVEASIDKVRLDGGALAPRVHLMGSAVTFARDEVGARGHVELSTERSSAPLVVEARADAASLAVQIEARGGPLELEGDPRAEIAIDGEATFDASARRFEARGALRIRGVQVQRRWLGAAPFALDAGIAGHAVLDPSGDFRLADAVFDFGPARALRGRVSAAGNVRSLRVQADAVLDPVDCNAAVVSLPEPVRATVGRLRFEGRKGISVHLEASVAAPEATQLVVRESGSCTTIAAPKDIAPEAFDAPFVMQVTSGDGRPRLETFGPGTEHWRPIARVSRAFLAGVLTTEDAGFFQHGGVAWYAIRSALVDDLKARRFVRGGSTITMQLAKNLFLNRDKNLARKLEEVLLTDYLEDAFGKERILELYANVVELGPDVFGVEAAARHYFGVGADELGVLEGMWLATLLPSPRERGHARRDGTLSEAKLKELRFLARKARGHGWLTDDDVADAERGDVTLPRREGVEVRVPGHGIEPPRAGTRPAVIEGP
jgi:hypothetical protein